MNYSYLYAKNNHIYLQINILEKLILAANLKS